MVSRVMLGSLVAAVLALSALEARAQEPAPAPAAAPVPQAPDVVLLRNGNLYRGTIAEKVETHVTILLVTGETRTLPTADVAFAGPAEQLPPLQVKEDDDQKQNQNDEGMGAELPAPTVDAAAGPYLTHFTSNRSNLQFAVVEHESGAEPRALEGCRAPCKLQLPENTYTFAVRAEDGQGLIGQRRVLLDRPSNVDAEYRSRAGVRSAGGIVAVVSGLVAGLVLIADVSDTDHEVGPLTYASAVLGGVGMIVGFSLLGSSDAAELKVTPLPD